jgi:hypothetical protein
MTAGKRSSQHSCVLEEEASDTLIPGFGSLQIQSFEAL